MLTAIFIAMIALAFVAHFQGLEAPATPQQERDEPPEDKPVPEYWRAQMQRIEERDERNRQHFAKYGC